ncbi:hypothetical protein ACGF8B_10820 [Streptomyces sp. NPDC047917]|uniref:hypothetical protein n=1 Tax=Streptomyces sp. NPDC047917 TaxID=3365491 RepID=UPI003722728D
MNGIVAQWGGAECSADPDQHIRGGVLHGCAHTHGTQASGAALVARAGVHGCRGAVRQRVDRGRPGGVRGDIRAACPSRLPPTGCFSR